MAVVGVICEYNPFHLGHARQIRWIRQRFGGGTAVVCCMSGSFVQRGEPAVFDKFTRAKAAVLSGADLVVELPLTAALSSAEGFAQGGVAALDGLGCVDALCFGSEHGQVEPLWAMARLLLSPAFPAALQEELNGKVSFAAARAAAVERLGGDGSLLRRPNDILAVEYLKALENLGSSMEPVTVLRAGDYHDAAPDPEHPSATALRLLLETGGDWQKFMPPEAAAVFAGAPQHRMAWGERAVLARLRTMTDGAFEALPFGSEGLWNRFAAACRREPSVEAILQAVKSKRYALSRLRRMVLCAYLGLTAEDLRRPVPYVRVLAFNDRGRSLLRQARERGKLPVVNAGEAPPGEVYYTLERRAADLYGLFLPPDVPPDCGAEERGRVFYAK